MKGRKTACSPVAVRYAYLPAFPQQRVRRFDPSRIRSDTYDKPHTLLTSDRGLCSGVNSAVCKAGKMAVSKFDDASKTRTYPSLVTKEERKWGVYADNIAYTMDETWKNRQVLTKPLRSPTRC